MRNLFEESPQKLCRYSAYKIFNFIRLFHDISLLVFMMEFIENEKGDWIATDARIYKIFTHRKELSYMPSKGDLIIPSGNIVERIQQLQSEINADLKTKQAKEQAVFLTQKAIEDEDFIKKVHLADKDKDEDILWLTSKPYKEMPHESMQNAKFKEYIKFKKQLQAEFGESSGYTSKSDRRYKLNRQLEHINIVFQQLNPNMRKKLSEVVAEEDYEFDKAYKKYMMTPIPEKTEFGSKVLESNQTTTFLKTEDGRFSLSSNKNPYHLKLDSLLKKQKTEVMASPQRSSRSKNSSAFSFLNRKAKSIEQDQVLTAEESITNTYTSQLVTDRIPLKEKGYLPLLGIAHTRSTSLHQEPFTKQAVVDALEEQIGVAHSRNRSTRMRRDHIIMSMQLSHNYSTSERQRRLIGTKLSVDKGTMDKKIESMQECQLDTNFWNWLPNMPELSCVSNAVPNKPAPDRQILRSTKGEKDVGLRLKNTNTRLQRTGVSQFGKQGYLLKIEL